MNKLKKALIFINCFCVLGVLWFLFSRYSLDVGADKKFIARRIVNILEFELLFFALLFYRYVFQTVKQFFTSKEHPFNLAVIRIVIFSLLCAWNVEPVKYFSNLPVDLQVIPKGLGFLAPMFNVDPHFISILLYIFKITAFLSVIGLFSRFSMIVCALLSLYLLGIPQIYGKINHYHHVVWFALILSVSPCFHCLSLDNFLKRRKNQVLSYGKSIIYSLPIRFMWILIGYLYFSAGFPKWWFRGIDWVFSNSLAYRMYFKWMDFPGIWTPFVRIDQNPFLLKASALGVVFFELSFIFFIFFPKLRYVAVFGGIIFHQLTYVFLRIRFVSLQICYVVFFNWYEIIKYLEKKIFKKEFIKEQEAKLSSQKAMRKHLIAPTIVGCLLILGNFYCGAQGLNSWPVTTYPAFFQVFDKPYFARLEIMVTPHGGEAFALRNHPVIEKIGRVHYFDMIDKILLIQDSSQRNNKLEQLWQMFVDKDKSLGKAQKIEFYRATFTFIPEERHKNPLYKKLIYQINNQ